LRLPATPWPAGVPSHVACTVHRKLKTTDLLDRVAQNAAQSGGRGPGPPRRGEFSPGLLDDDRDIAVLTVEVVLGKSLAAPCTPPPTTPRGMISVRGRSDLLATKVRELPGACRTSFRTRLSGL
jgi:hypothetical protein